MLTNQADYAIINTVEGAMANLNRMNEKEMMKMKITMFATMSEVRVFCSESGYPFHDVNLAQIYALYEMAGWRRAAIADHLGYAVSTVSTKRSKMWDYAELAEMLFGDVEIVEEVVEESEDAEEEVAADGIEEQVVEETSEESGEEDVGEEEEVEEASQDELSEDFSDGLDALKKKLAEKEKKLSNQSSELNYLTNKIIPKLKKENAELKGLKKELTNALEKSTRKYFDQLDINADLSNQIGKLGAEGAVNKVRADKLENEINSIKEELQSKIDGYKEKLDSINVVEIKNQNKELTAEVDDLKEKLSEARKENISLSEEVDKLRAELIDLGNYKEEVDNQNKKEISEYKDEISSLKTQLKLKESSYDKLSNESKKTITDLHNQIAKLEEELEKQSNKGLFNRFK